MDILKRNFFHKKSESLYLHTCPQIKTNLEYTTKIFDESNSTEKILNNISLFVENNFSKNLLSPLPINLPLENILKYFNINSQLEIIYDKSNLLGVNVGFYLPIDIKTELDKNSPLNCSEELKSLCYKDSIIVEYSTYVVIDKKRRNRNTASYLLHSGIKHLYDQGILMFMGSHGIKRTLNPVEYTLWYYPLNFSILDKIDYLYPRNYKSLYKLEATKYSVKEINESNIIKSFDFYLKETENKKFCFKPSFILWKKWIKSFSTYIILDENEIVGLFSYEIIKTHNKKHDVIVNKGNLLLCIGCLKTALYHIKTEADLVFINELGDITENDLMRLYAQKISTRYLNIYNTRIKLDKSDICIPIF